MKTSSVVRPLVLAGIAFAGGAAATLFSPTHARATSQDEDAYAAVAQLARVLVQVENDYVDPVDRARLLNGAIRGMVSELDPHSAYMPPHEWTEFRSETEGKFGGIGITVDVRDEQLTVLAPIEGAPADRAGLRSGDVILAVDGEEAHTIGLEKMVRHMRGDPGTHVKLTVKRDGDPAHKEAMTFDLVREIIHVPSVSAKLLEGGIAYVRVKQFQEHTHDELVAAAAKLRLESHDKLTGVLFDLRANPGGLVDEATGVADEFLTSGTIYTMRHRGQIWDEAKATSGGAFSELPVVTLVNEWSASAAELVAGALQDQRRTLVMGVNTFGKGSVQSILELPNNAGMRLTTARYYTPSGHAIQADGVHPDVIVEGPPRGEFPIVRERDLEGHLAAEATPEPKKTRTTIATSDAGTNGDVEGELGAVSMRDVPTDPAKGKDVVLREGYELLVRTLVGRGPIVK